MPSLSVRLGDTLFSQVQNYCRTFPLTMTKSQAIQYLLMQYLQCPQTYSVLDVRALREPLEHSITIMLPEELQHQLLDMAAGKRLKVSEVLRMAIYQELIIHGNQL